MPKTPKTPPEDYEPFIASPRRALEILAEEYRPDAPPPAAPDTSAGRAVIVVIPPGPYSPQEYAEMARTIAREFAHWPTPAPQLTAALAAAVLQWARAQPD